MTVLFKNVLSEIFCIFIELSCKEIKNITQRTGVSFVQLGVAALGAAYHGEFFVLYVKNFGKSTAGCADGIGFKLLVAAFGAFVLFHGFDI